MTDLRTAAQQALEALNSIDVGYRSPSGDPLEVSFDEVKCEAAIAALRAALAQQAEPVREPVAWIHTDLDKPRVKFLEWRENEPGYRGRWIKTPLYAAPPRCPNCSLLEAQNTELDRKLAELDQDEPVQEPVAWLYEAGADRTLHWYKPPLCGTPLYTAPPQRKPLTDEEIRRICDAHWCLRQLARAVERAHGIGKQP